MNKLLGFYELKDSTLPTIPWREYSETTVFDEGLLWTVRTAVHRGSDLNLPRAVGVTADEAKTFARNAAKQLGQNGMVIYYPYFLAEKSGTMDVYRDRVVIEAVRADLWNLVSHSDREVTIVSTEHGIDFYGNSEFIPQKEWEELTSYVGKVRQMFRTDMLEGKSALLEWSYAYQCDIEKKKVGNKYLVFYEVRTV